MIEANIKRIVFDSKKHGKVTLSSGFNTLTNDYMYWWASKKDHSSYVATKNDILNIVRNIRKKESNIELDDVEK